MSPRQGWDLATYRCGRCGYRFSTNAEADYVARVADHSAAHSFAETLPPPVQAELTRLLPHLSSILGRH